MAVQRGELCRAAEPAGLGFDGLEQSPAVFEPTEGDSVWAGSDAPSVASDRKPARFGSSSRVSGFNDGPSQPAPWPWLDSTNRGAPSGTVGRICTNGGKAVRS